MVETGLVGFPTLPSWYIGMEEDPNMTILSHSRYCWVAAGVPKVKGLQH